MSCYSQIYSYTYFKTVNITVLPFFLLEFFCQNYRLSVNSVLSLQGDTPTFSFEVLYHFWQGLVAYWLVTSTIDRQIAVEANTTAPSKMMGYGPHPLSIQNKILVSKLPFYVSATYIYALHYIKWTASLSLSWLLDPAWILLCISQSL